MKFSFLSVFKSAVFIATLTTATAGFAQDKVIFGLNWYANSDHGGYYQSLADGTYKKYGLDVEIKQGGPQVNNRPLLATGKIDFMMGGNLLQGFDAVKNGLPIVAVAAIFQKEPQAIVAHPGQGYDKFSDLTKAPTIFIGKGGQFSFWQWMKSEHGFRDEQLKPYTFNIGPFLSDKKSAQQAYASSEPITVLAKGGFAPVVHLLADHGFSSYATLIETRTDLVQSNPKLVQRFVEASIIGYYNYIYGDRKAANELMKKANPEMTDEYMAASMKLNADSGIIDSGDALTMGIGAISAARVKDFYDKMVKAGLYKPGEVDLGKVIDTQFANKGVGLDIKKRLTGK